MRDMIELAEHLRKLGTKEIEPIDERWGICTEIGFKFQLLDIFLNKQLLSLMYKWPKASGNFFYPVVDSCFDSPKSALVHTSNCWSLSPYGDDRRELCIWLSKQLVSMFHGPLHPCYCAWNKDYDHDWEEQDDSFDHEFGTEQIYFNLCLRCLATTEVDSGDLGECYDYECE